MVGERDQVIVARCWRKLIQPAGLTAVAFADLSTQPHHLDLDGIRRQTKLRHRLRAQPLCEAVGAHEQLPGLISVVNHPLHPAGRHPVFYMISKEPVHKPIPFTDCDLERSELGVVALVGTVLANRRASEAVAESRKAVAAGLSSGAALNRPQPNAIQSARITSRSRRDDTGRLAAGFPAVLSALMLVLALVFQSNHR